MSEKSVTPNQTVQKSQFNLDLDPALFKHITR